MLRHHEAGKLQDSGRSFPQSFLHMTLQCTKCGVLCRAHNLCITWFHEHHQQ